MHSEHIICDFSDCQSQQYIITRWHWLESDPRGIEATERVDEPTASTLGSPPVGSIIPDRLGLQ
jgi:hypothetical protein